MGNRKITFELTSFKEKRRNCIMVLTFIYGDDEIRLENFSS